MESNHIIFKIGYNQRFAKFKEAVKSVWPDYLGYECSRLLCDVKHLEKLTITSYRLMAHIKSYLNSCNLYYEEGGSVPNLYSSLENVVKATMTQKKTLVEEARTLEQVSRAAFNWIKLVSKNNVSYCIICRNKQAADDSDMLCKECCGS